MVSLWTIELDFENNVLSVVIVDDDDEVATYKKSLTSFNLDAEIRRLKDALR